MRGGKRQNAGRKPAQNARVVLSARVEKKTKDALFEQAEKENISVGRVIDNIVNKK